MFAYVNNICKRSSIFCDRKTNQMQVPCTTSRHTTAKNDNPSGAASQPIAKQHQTTIMRLSRGSDCWRKGMWNSCHQYVHFENHENDIILQKCSWKKKKRVGVHVFFSWAKDQNEWGHPTCRALRKVEMWASRLITIPTWFPSQYWELAVSHERCW